MYNFPPLHNGQNLVHSERKRFNVLYAGRRWRKTTYMSLLMFRYALKYRGEYLWASPTHDQNKIAVSYMEKIGGNKIDVNRSSMMITFKNKSIIRFRSLVKPDNARGFTIDGVCIDESAYVNGDAFFEVIRPTLMSSLGWAFLGSTPNGQNWMYDLYTAGAKEDTAVWRIPSYGVRINPITKELEREEHEYENPDLLFAELLSLYDQMDSYSFRQEILCEFLESLLNPFTNIDLLCTNQQLGGSTRETVAGIDFGKTIDPSCVSIMDRKTMQEIALFRLPLVDYTLQLELISDYVRRYNVKHITFDSTGVGVKLAEDMYQKFSGKVGLDPVSFTNDVKAKLMMDLILMMEKKKVTFTSDRESKEEFKKFIRKISGNFVIFEASAGHDDSVIARSLAVRGVNSGRLFA